MAVQSAIPAKPEPEAAQRQDHMIRRLLSALIVLTLMAAAWLTLAPPDLIRVGANYSAKIVCSNLVLAARDPDEVLAVDVQAPGHPLLRFMRLSVTEDGGRTIVRTGLFGFIGNGLAISDDPAMGCTSIPSGNISEIPRLAANPGSTVVRNDDQPQIVSGLEPEVDAILANDALIGPGMRAVVVLKNGRVIAERYASGFGPQTRLLGWSVTKTVTAAMIGRAVREDRLDLLAPIHGLGWDGDPREAISWADLMGMASDLAWNEGYGSVSDVTRMLFLERDMAAFAAGQPLDRETPGGIGDVFEYSSGTTVILSRLLTDALEPAGVSGDIVRDLLFDPLGMESAVLERDASGTPVGSSYMYATARDWATFGQFLLQRGVWNGRSLLPVGYVDWMVEPHPASDGAYGRGQLWLRPANAWMDDPIPELPDDAFYMNGHDGQSVNVFPSRDLVVVRLGLTPTSHRYQIANLLDAVIKATESD